MFKKIHSWFYPERDKFTKIASGTGVKTTYVATKNIVKEDAYIKTNSKSPIIECQVYKQNRTKQKYNLIIVEQNTKTEKEKEAAARIERGFDAMLKMRSDYLINVNDVFLNHAEGNYKGHLCACVQDIEGKKRILGISDTLNLHKKNNTNSFNFKITQYMIRAFRGLEDIHAHDMVHRGLTLSSLIFDDKDQLYIESYLNLKSFHIPKGDEITHSISTQEECIYYSPEVSKKKEEIKALKKEREKNIHQLEGEKNVYIKNLENETDSHKVIELKNNIEKIDETINNLKEKIKKAEEESDIKIYKQSDIYALGIVMYKLLTTEFPIKSNVNYEIREEIEKKIEFDSPEEKIKSIQSKNLKIIPAHKELYRICSKAIKKDPNERYSSAEEVLHDLQNLYNKLYRKQIISRIYKCGFIIGAIVLMYNSPIDYRKFYSTSTNKEQIIDVRKLGKLDSNILEEVGRNYHYGRAPYPQNYTKALECYEMGHNNNFINCSYKYVQLLLDEQLPLKHKKKSKEIINIMIASTNYWKDQKSKLNKEEKMYVGNLFTLLGNMSLYTSISPGRQEAESALEHYVNALDYQSLLVYHKIGQLYQKNLITAEDEKKYPLLLKELNESETTNTHKAIAYFIKSINKITNSGEGYQDILSQSHFDLGLLYLRNSDEKSKTEAQSQLNKAKRLLFRQ